MDEAARLDEQVEAGRLPSDVFGQIRSLMQHNTSLNFIFCVGERLELMRSQYAMLFNVALYKEISFLDRRAAESLIVQPTQSLYGYQPEAIDRIIEITAGHAYFMQLLCHSLFAGWQRDNKPSITVEDVEAVVSEVVERGSANLKFDWDESLPVEKLFLGAMAEAMENGAASITTGGVSEVLRRYDILVPQGEVVSAQRSLIGKELVFGADEVRFAIDFLRLWVRQHERVEWVKEELSGEIETLREEAEAAEAERRATRKRFRWGSLVGVVGPGGGLAAVRARVAPAGLQRLDGHRRGGCRPDSGLPGPGQVRLPDQAAGAILAMCLDTVEKLSNDTMRFNLHWTATIRNERFNAVNRKGSTTLDPVPYLRDESGNTYNFLDVGGSAALQVAVGHGQNSEPGWFLFPELEDGVTSVDLVDVVDGQEMVIQEIVLQ